MQLIVVRGNTLECQGQPVFEARGAFKFFEWRRHDGITHAAPEMVSTTPLFDKLDGRAVFLRKQPQPHPTRRNTECAASLAFLNSAATREPTPAALREMCRVMAHRGPDDDGFYTDGALGIGMRRLSIVDLATGHQPISNEDGSLWIVFNGEIYNHLALREQLDRPRPSLRNTQRHRNYRPPV